MGKHPAETRSMFPYICTVHTVSTWYVTQLHIYSEDPRSTPRHATCTACSSNEVLTGVGSVQVTWTHAPHPPCAKPVLRGLLLMRVARCPLGKLDEANVPYPQLSGCNSTHIPAQYTTKGTLEDRVADKTTNKCWYKGVM